MMKDLSMHLLDISENSTRANALNIEIILIEDEASNLFSFSIKDDGKGMSDEMMASVRNPFTTSRTTRKVGLGIPMLEQTCLQCGGNLELRSEIGVGTFIKASMEYNNIDRPPLGDIANTIFLMVLMHPDINIKYIHVHNGKEYILDTKEVKEVLDGVPFDEPDVTQWLKENIYEGIQEIQ